MQAESHRSGNARDIATMRTTMSPIFMTIAAGTLLGSVPADAPLRGSVVLLRLKGVAARPSV